MTVSALLVFAIDEKEDWYQANVGLRCTVYLQTINDFSKSALSKMQNTSYLSGIGYIITERFLKTWLEQLVATVLVVAM